MKTLYLEQVGGASGDMLLGALVALGVDVATLQAGLDRLGIAGLRLEAREVERHGLRAVQVRVHAGDHDHPHDHHPHDHNSHDHHSHDHHSHDHHSHDHPHHPEPDSRPGADASRHSPHRSLSTIVALIRGSGLPPPVVEASVAVFTRLGEAEAAEHGVPLEAVHFHEVGAVDSIADVVGVCLGLHLLGVERLVSSAFLFGRGRVDMAHGSWPVPAPATVRLTRGHPVRFTDLEGETVTPTAAALIVTLADSIGTSPGLRLERAGAGAGSREWPDRPNVLRAFLGAGGGGGTGADEVAVLTTAIDDATPEVIGGLTGTLLEAGALDVLIEPVQMKKGRPGIRVEVLAPPALEWDLARRLFLETSTIGIRHRREERWVLPRRSGTVALPWGRVAVKISELPDGSRRIAPEYEDCLRLSHETGIPVMEILRAASLSEVAEN